MGKHEDECKPFNLARKFDLIHCVAHSPDYFSPPTFHMEYEDPEDNVAKVGYATLKKKKILILKCCPFCGKILEGQDA